MTQLAPPVLVRRALAGGDFAVDVTVRNTSRTTCTISGWPGLTLRGSDAALSCPAGDDRPECGTYADKDSISSVPFARHGDQAPRIRLAPTGTTRFSVIELGTTCVLAAYRLEIRVPGDSRALSVRDPENMVCTGDGSLEVTAFGYTAS